jgi:hypothetical protein
MNRLQGMYRFRHLLLKISTIITRSTSTVQEKEKKREKKEKKEAMYRKKVPERCLILLSRYNVCSYAGR